MYFEFFSKIKDYNLNGVSGGFSVSLADIFRRIKFTNKTLSNTRSFIDYNIKDGETPENISLEFYGSEEWSWLVLFSNNIIDPLAEWPKNSLETQRQLKDSGKSYFVHDDKDIRGGDIIVKSETCSITPGIGGCPDGISLSMENYSVVDSWDKNLYKINSSRIVGTLSEDDYITILRKNSSGEYDMIGGETFCSPHYLQTQIQKVTDFQHGANTFFYNGNEISPLTDTNNFTDKIYPTTGLCNEKTTVLYKYIDDDVSGFEVTTELEKIHINNDSKRNIQLIHPVLKEEILNEIKLLLTDSETIGKTSLVERK